MNKKRKICVVVTARPSYSRFKTALKAINEHPDLELQLVIAGSALLERYGSVVDYIIKDGFEIKARVFNVLEGENLNTSAKTTGLGIIELSTVFDTLNPDIVITIADRYETIATAIAASYMNIPLAHIQGGEVTGNIDEKVRHSITKLADYHFVASDDARKRVIKMGEYPDFVFNTGCPSIDIADEILKETNDGFNPFDIYTGVGATREYFNDGFVVMLQHPVTNEYHDSLKQVEETLHAIKDTNRPLICFWPNIDAGSDGTSKGLRTFREKHHEYPVHFFKNMEGKDFLRLLKKSLCLVGNSSVGIRESAWLGVPVVNIGSRQNRRERGRNVVDVDYSRSNITAAINQQLEKGQYSSDPVYGGGAAGKEIAKILVTVPLKCHKTISY